MHKLVEEMSAGLSLDHQHVIKSYQCWEDPSSKCINMITEFFTSGNLRDYRQRHKAVDIKAVKKWARQILQGLTYLHQRHPPVVHGDLRLDKIYVNGHSGEIKIGDLGLSVLVPKRFAPGVMPEGDPSNQYTRAVDIFAFGLVVLELVTAKKMDRSNTAWSMLLDGVGDQSARQFIEKCLAPIEERPSAGELLKDPFLQAAPKNVAGSTASSAAGTAGGGAGASGGIAGAVGMKTGVSVGTSSVNGPITKGGTSGILSKDTVDGRRGEGTSNPTAGGAGSAADDQQQQRAECEAGSVRGEDYLFQFTGKIKEGKLHFRLHMHYEGDGDDDTVGTSKTIDFVYDPDVDTPDEIAAEISSEFNLSPTDMDICAAALKEWLADQGPDPSST